MALNFQGDRAVGVLNDPKNTFNTDDFFRVYDGGILVAGGVSVDHGDFVSWDGTKWKLETDIKIARSDEISNTNSNIAPNYTKKTYEANSYVMQDGVLYTNPNAIGTAEDWNPAHWTQTTVAEMMASAQKKYVSVTKTATYDSDNNQYAIDVNQKEVITAEIATSSAMSYSSKLYLNLGTTDDAIIIIKKQGNYINRLSNIAFSRQMSEIYLDYIHSIECTDLDSDISSRIILTDEWEEGHGGDYPVIPTDISNTELLAGIPNTRIVSSVYNRGLSLVNDLIWIIRVIGDNALIATRAS